MNDNLGILFLHHAVNDIVRNNLASVRRQNPAALIVTMSAGEPLSGGYSLGATPELQALHASGPKTCADWLVCAWFVQRKEEPRKWWIIEWDVFCTMPAREYYQAVWDYPFVATCVRRPNRDRGWPWFRNVAKMPSRLRPHAMGAAPFLYLLDDNVLQQVCTHLLTQPFSVGNCELRFATVANSLGLAPCGFSPPNDHISWMPLKHLPRTRGIFHPVKFHASDLSSAEGEAETPPLAADGVRLLP